MSEAQAQLQPGVRLRPRSPDEIIDLSVRYLSANPGLLRGALKIIAAQAVLLTGLGLGLWLAGVGAADGAGWLLGGVVLLTALNERAASVQIGRHLFHQVAGAGAVWWEVFKHPATIPGVLISCAPELFSVALGVHADSAAEGLTVGIATLLSLRFPWLIVSGLYLREALFLERLPYRQARKRTARLRARSGAASTALLLGFFLRFGLAAVCGAVVLSLGGVLANAVWWPAALVALPVGYALAAPILGSVHLFSYVQSRTEEEGWDIQVMFFAIRAADAEARRFKDAA